MFSLTDPDEHARMKRPIAKHYSPGSVLSIEPLVDTVIGQFCHHLEERFVIGPNEGRTCDLGEWIAYCKATCAVNLFAYCKMLTSDPGTWDMVGAASFSELFGYMDKGCDYDGTIEIADKALD